MFLRVSVSIIQRIENTFDVLFSKINFISHQSWTKVKEFQICLPFSFLETSFISILSCFSRSLTTSVFLVAAVSVDKSLLMDSEVSTFNRCIFIRIVSILGVFDRYTCPPDFGVGRVGESLGCRGRWWSYRRRTTRECRYCSRWSLNDWNNFLCQSGTFFGKMPRFNKSYVDKRLFNYFNKKMSDNTTNRLFQRSHLF